MAAADVGQGFEPMPGQGVSDSWVEQKRNVKRIFNLMMEAVNTDGHACNGKYPNTFDALTAVDATSKELWGLVATWLSTGYVTNKNRAAGVEEKFLHPNTAVSYLRSALNLAKEKFLADNTTHLCFTCVLQNSQTEDGMWLKGLIKNMHRLMCRRVRLAAWKNRRLMHASNAAHR